MLGARPLLLLVVAACHLALTSATSQPFLAWSQDESLRSMQVPRVAEATALLTSLTSDSSQSRVSVVFVQDDVTVEDITTFSQACENTPFLKRAHESASSRMFFPISSFMDASALSARLDTSSSSVVLDAKDVSADAVQGRSLVVVRLPAAAMKATDEAVETAVSSIDAAVEAPLTVFFVGTSSPSFQEATTLARGRRSTGDISQKPDLLPEPSYVASRPEQRHEVALQWFSIPILSGIIVGVLFVFTVIVGTCGLMATQTPEQWPDANHDKNLDVPQ